MKKTFTTIVIILSLLSCRAQLPDISSYSKRIIDSLNTIITVLSDSNQIFKDSIHALNNPETIQVDTAYYYIEGLNDNTSASLYKKGKWIKTTITEDTLRLTTIYDNGTREVWFMNDRPVTADSTYSDTLFHFEADSTGKRGTFSFK